MTKKRLQELRHKHRETAEYLSTVEVSDLFIEIERLDAACREKDERIARALKLADLSQTNETRWMQKHSELEDENARLREALTAIKADGGCFCDFHASQHTDYPMAEHKEFCIKAEAALGEKSHAD